MRHFTDKGTETTRPCPRLPWSAWNPSSCSSHNFAFLWVPKLPKHWLKENNDSQAIGKLCHFISLPVYLWPAPSVEWSLVCVWRCKLRLSSRARWNGLDHGRDPPLGTGLFGHQRGPSCRFLPPACSLSDWPCTVSSLIGGLARSISGVAHSASIFFAFHSLFLFRVIRDNKRELGFITWHLEE